MKFGPKETKQLNEYLRTGRNKNRQFLTTELVDDLEPGSLKDELLKDFDPSQETYEEYLQRKNLERPFNMADGGRIGFYKAGFVKSNPPGQQYVVKFASKSTSPGYPDKFIGTQKYATEKLANKAIEEREILAEKNYAKRANFEVIQKEKNIKDLVDKTFKTKNFANFKAKPTESQLRFAKRLGKAREGSGIVPAQYMKIFDAAKKGGPDSKEFKDLIRITGRSAEDILKLNELRPSGAVPLKVRAKAAAKSFPEYRKKTELEKKESAKKTKVKRAGFEKIAKDFASEADLQDIKLINQGKKNINKFFQSNPNAINDTAFGRNIKNMMAIRVGQDGNFYSRLLT